MLTYQSTTRTNWVVVNILVASVNRRDFSLVHHQQQLAVRYAHNFFPSLHINGLTWVSYRPMFEMIGHRHFHIWFTKLTQIKKKIIESQWGKRSALTQELCYDVISEWDVCIFDLESCICTHRLMLFAMQPFYFTKYILLSFSKWWSEPLCISECRNYLDFFTKCKFFLTI